VAPFPPLQHDLRLSGRLSREEREDAHCFEYPEHLIVGAERTRVGDDSVVLCQTFLGHQAQLLAEELHWFRGHTERRLLAPERLRSGRVPAAFWGQ
jgi:hypothetical protein